MRGSAALNLISAKEHPKTPGLTPGDRFARGRERGRAWSDLLGKYFEGMAGRRKAL